jgi:hypothetical protein
MRRTILHGLVVSPIILSACSSTPGIWPLSEPTTNVSSYPSAFPEGTTDLPQCDNGTPDYDAAPNGAYYRSAALARPDLAAQYDLYCAQKKAVETQVRYAGEQRRLEAIKNGEVLALFGLGAAGGIETVVTKSATPVKNIGLAAVSLVGLSSSVGVDGQRSIYQAGAKAIGCLIEVDAALDVAVAKVAASAEPEDKQSATVTGGAATPTSLPVALSSPTPPSTASPRRLAFLTLLPTSDTLPASAAADAPLGPLYNSVRKQLNAIEQQQAQRSIVASDFTPTLETSRQNMLKNLIQTAPVTPAVKTDTSNAAATQLHQVSLLQASDALAEVKHAKEADNKLRSSLVTSTGPHDRTQNLLNTLDQIDNALSDELYSNVDVTKVYSAAKAGYSSLASNVSANQQTTKQTSGKAKHGGTGTTGTANPTDTTTGGLKIAESVTDAVNGATPDNPSSDTTQVEKAVKQATDDANATDTLTQTYASCVGMAAPKSTSTAGQSPDSSG